MLDPVAEEARAAFRVADRDQHLAELRRDDEAGEQIAARESERRQHKQRGARGGGLQRKSEDVLEIGQAVIAAKAHVVAKKRQHQRIGHGLRDDRKIDARNAGAKGEPAEHEGEKAGNTTTIRAANQNMSKPCQNQGSSCQFRNTMKSGSTGLE